MDFKKIGAWILIAIGAVYATLCIVVYTFPQFIFYRPSPIKSDINHAHKYGYKAREVTYNSKDGTQLFAWYTPPHSGQQKVIVFMHGNSHNIEEYYHKLITFADEGYGTLLPEYRGFGGIEGHINQANLEADAIAAVEFLYSQGFANKDIYIYGMSLGSHLGINAVYRLQKRKPFAGLILEVPFDSLLNVAKMAVPVPMPFDTILRDQYDNLGMIDFVRSPILIMGGSKDGLVPVDLAQNLYNYAPDPKNIIIYENGGHNNLFNFRNDLDVLEWMGANENGWLEVNEESFD